MEKNRQGMPLAQGRPFAAIPKTGTGNLGMAGHERSEVIPDLVPRKVGRQNCSI